MIGVVRIALYYYRFRPDNIDRSYSVTYTLSGIEVNVAIIAACGPAFKALCTQYGLKILGSSSPTRPSKYPYGSAEGTARRPELQGYSRQRDQAVAKSYHSDAQYGLKDLGTIDDDGDGTSQDAIVRSASVGTRQSEFDFGLETDHTAHNDLKASH